MKQSPPRSPAPHRVVVPVLLVLALGTLAACGASAPTGGDVLTGPAIPGTSAVFTVLSGANLPVAGATVYLVPASHVSDAPISGDDVLTGAAEDRDEPLEDPVRLNGATYPQGVTDAAGRTVVQNVPAGRYFFFVAPGPADDEHLPGGSESRVARDSSSFLGLSHTIIVSSRPGPTARYLGTSVCLTCHTDLTHIRQHAHRLGFSVPGQFSALQDPVRYPEFNDGLNPFTPASSYAGGTVVYLSDFDPSRGFDKFKASLTDPTPRGETVYVKAYLWRNTSGGSYMITLQNVKNPADPRNFPTPWTAQVRLTYGGAVYKQRYLIQIAGRKGLYPLLQYQTEGDDGRWERTRRSFRDYHLDWYWDNATERLKDPPLGQNFEGNCTACHSTGFERYQDPSTMEWLTRAVSDTGGAYDLDGDGDRDEINVGCEVCHGPGSDHVNWALQPQNAGHQARYIVCLQYLSPEREMMVCGRCHDRPHGNGSRINDEPLNAMNEMAPPGISRADFLATFTSRKGPAASDYWADDRTSKSHHQQYSDMLKSTMHRNDRVLTTCSDCHDSHGKGPYRHHLKHDPDDRSSALCFNCHNIDLGAHSAAKVGFDHGTTSASCVSCHMVQAAKTGAGVYGLLLGTPTGTVLDDTRIYYHNDITSHLFTVPRKTHPSVAGQTPVAAMPIPFTNSCAQPCHFGGSIPKALPATVPSWLAPPGPEDHEPDGYGGPPER